MLRHLKMELKRQQQESLQQAFTGIDQQVKFDTSAPIIVKPVSGKVLTSKPASHKDSLNNGNSNNKELQQTTQRRVRGRRSSKPLMEKRRRARINQCLDILKSYVLTDSTNLSQLGIDAASRENRDEETIARTILKSSGLINRHRGRKNPNKLEKADILELTVDYVRRLHQRLVNNNNNNNTIDSLPAIEQLRYTTSTSSLSAASISSPLSLDLSPIDNSRQATHIALKPVGAPPSPPPSSASSSPQPLLSISSNSQHSQLAQRLTQTSSSDVLDLSDCRRKETMVKHLSQPIFKDGTIFIEGADGCWRPWDPSAVGGGGAGLQ